MATRTEEAQVMKNKITYILTSLAANQLNKDISYGVTHNFLSLL